MDKLMRKHKKNIDHLTSYDKSVMDPMFDFQEKYCNVEYDLSFDPIAVATDGDLGGV